MPAYDRFWDLQISSGGQYDWKEEIVQNCIYQRESKRTNNVNGKALITLPNLSNVEVTVAACLRRLRNVAVTVDFAGSSQAAVMMSTLVAGMGKHLDFRTLVLDDSVTATSKKMLKIYAKEFATLDTAPADNRAYRLSQASTVYTFQKLPVAADADIVLVDESARPSVALLATDPRIGYLSTTVNMGDIADGGVQDYGRDMVTWILGGGKAKIRITCHGDGEGHFEMKDRGSTLRSVRADAVAAWLVANGLRQKGNLETINVNICMGAKGNITPAVLKAGVYTPADGSAVGLIARRLGEAGVHGVRVTGANEVIAGIEQKELEGDNKLTPVSGGPLLAGQGVRKIQIPAGFGFEAATLTITVPARWSIEAVSRDESRLFVLKPPATWTMKKLPSVFVRPAETANADFEFTGPASEKVSIPSAGWMVEGGNVFTAEGWVAGAAGKLRFQGTGGTVALDGASAQKTILERLAKSKAKAVAVS